MRIFLLLLVCSSAIALRIDPSKLPKEMQHSALREFLAANRYEVPDSLEGWKVLLDQGGENFDTLIPFSASPFHTDLEEPRYVASPHPYLYLALIQRLDGSLDAEFISWNKEETEANFGSLQGIVSGGMTPPEVKMADIQECRTCHRTLGAIFTDRPWNNVTGANAPNGFHFSMAMLGKYLEKEPEKYSRYQNLFDNRNSIYDFYFANLKPEPVVRLADLHFHGVPLFRFRGSFDFDANVRKSHLLVLTFQIMKELTPAGQKQLARTLAERALKGAVYPDRLDYLFNWNEILKAEMKKNAELALLPAAKSPIQKNLMPVFENPELLRAVRLTTADIEADPVAAILKLSDYVREKRISGYRAEDKPSAGGQAFVDFKPAENSSPSTACNLLMELTRADVRTLRQYLTKNHLTLDHIFQNETVKTNWLRGKRMVQKHELARAISQGTGYPLSFESSAVAVQGMEKRGRLKVGSFTPAQIEASRCLRCHSSPKDSSRDVGFPFDPLDQREWQKAFHNPAIRSEALDFAERMIDKLQGGHMPPPDSYEAKGFNAKTGEWAELVKFLKDNTR